MEAAGEVLMMVFAAIGAVSSILIGYALYEFLSERLEDLKEARSEIERSHRRLDTVFQRLHDVEMKSKGATSITGNNEVKW